MVGRSIEIVGDGDPASIVVLSEAGPCFHLNGTARRLSNLTLSGGGLLDSWIGSVSRREAALVISGGFPVVEDLIFRESHGIVVEGDDASPTVRRNVLLMGHGVGIWVRWGARGTIEGNEIVGNELAGIMLANEGTDPLVRANRIHDGAENYDAYGIYVCAGAAGTVEGNVVFDMFGGGIVADGPGTSPVIRGNTVTIDRVDGIMSRRGATPTLSDNTTS
jgi:parallel beta-helix repeat protein